MFAAVPPYDLLHRAGELRGLTKRGGLALLDQLTGDAARGRFFAEIAEKPDQLFFAVGVNDVGGRRLAPRVHPHIERAVALNAETALAIFELARRDTEIEQRTANRGDAQLIEDFSRFAEIALPKRHAPAEFRKPLGRVTDGIGVLVET